VSILFFKVTAKAAAQLDLEQRRKAGGLDARVHRFVWHRNFQVPIGYLPLKSKFDVEKAAKSCSASQASRGSSIWLIPIFRCSLMSWPLAKDNDSASISLSCSRKAISFAPPGQRPWCWQTVASGHEHNRCSIFLFCQILSKRILLAACFNGTSQKRRRACSLCMIIIALLLNEDHYTICRISSLIRAILIRSWS